MGKLAKANRAAREAAALAAVAQSSGKSTEVGMELSPVTATTPKRSFIEEVNDRYDATLPRIFVVGAVTDPRPRELR